ncbi:MAG: hypothetical protein RIC52_01180 [Amphiplicatus sp.]
MPLHSLILAAFLLGATPALAQGLSPMRQDFATYADQFAIQLKARNPYPATQRFSVSVFEADWRRSEACAVTPVLTVPPGETVSFLVAGETDAREARTIYVCVLSAPFADGNGASVRGEVCGKYRIMQRRL